MVCAVPKMLCATGRPRRRMDESSTSSMSNEAVCSIPTTFVIIARLSAGTCNHALNASMSCFRMSFPGELSRYSYGPSTIFSFSVDQTVPLTCFAILSAGLLGAGGVNDGVVDGFLRWDIQLPSVTGLRIGWERLA